MKIVRALWASAFFIIILVAIYYLHTYFFRINVVFYAAIADGLMAAILSTFLLYTVRYFSVFCHFEKIQLIVIWLLVGYALAISVPTVIDRSLSFYILEKLQQRGGGIKQESFEQVFTREYVREHRLIDVRLTEQMESGTIIIENGCVKLTEKGQEVARFGRYFRMHWLPKHRLLMGTYSDDLTNPFRNSTEVFDYKCR